jgi:drug/metabolite transporter (DMT)-like permease
VSNLIPVLLGAGAAVLWGVSDFYVKRISSRTGGVLATLIVFALSVPLLIPCILLMGVTVPNSPFIIALLVVGALIGTATVLAYYEALGRGDVSIIAPIGSTWPILTVVLAVVLLGETPGTLAIARAAALIGGGIVLSLGPKGTAVRGGRFAIGLAVLTAILFGLLFFITKPLVLALGPFLPLLAIRIAGIGICASLIIASGKGGKGRAAVGTWSGALLGVAVLVATVDTAGTVLYNIGVSIGDVAVVAPAGCITAAVAAMLGIAVYKERFDTRKALGLVLVTVGLLAVAL